MADDQYRERWSMILDAIVSWEDERDRRMQEEEDRLFVQREQALDRRGS